jgi:uncharacterized protein YqiB (DUF1249 family)
MMKQPDYPWSLKFIRMRHPSMDLVQRLSDENYHHLLRLAPDLQLLEGRHVSSLGHGLDLHLDVQDQTPYTSLIHLTYYFPHGVGHYPDPDATLRVYHDFRQVDVLDLRQSALPMQRWGSNPTLEQRWKINLFLSKWLSYCIIQGHRFSGSFQTTRQDHSVQEVI